MESRLNLEELSGVPPYDSNREHRERSGVAMESRLTLEELSGIPPYNSNREHRERILLRKLIVIGSIAIGVQFGWALQFSLLTPYAKVLGVPHQWAGYIWLCGSISGMIIQPLVGYLSDRSHSQFGRRRPFIIINAIALAMAYFLIGYAADLGHALGDDLSKKSRPRAIVIFVVGFWVLDVSNDMLQGLCRALIGDLTAGQHRHMRIGNGLYSFFMAIGNVCGFFIGSLEELYNKFPFMKTKACDVFCANIKTSFSLSIFLLLVLSTLVVLYVKELPSPSLESHDSFFGEVLTAFSGLQRPMWMLMLVTSINWVAWYSFFLFNTDWMGEEVFGGNPGDQAYAKGVRVGALGLMANAIVLGLMSLALEPLRRLAGSGKRVWCGANIILAIALVATVVITKEAERERHTSNIGTPSPGVQAATYVFFAVLGIPLAINFSIPFSLASSYSSARGQGLSLGVLNMSISAPQILVSAVSGHWASLFGGGNLPTFIVGAIAALISSTLAMTVLPTPNA